MIWVNIIISILLLGLAITVHVSAGAFLESKITFKITLAVLLSMIVLGGIVMRFTTPRPQGQAKISTMKSVLTAPLESLVGTHEEEVTPTEIEITQ